MIELIHAIPFPDWLDPILLKIGPIRLGWYGLAYVVGVALAYYYAFRLVKKPVSYTHLTLPTIYSV